MMEGASIEVLSTSRYPAWRSSSSALRVRHHHDRDCGRTESEPPCWNHPAPRWRSAPLQRAAERTVQTQRAVPVTDVSPLVEEDVDGYVVVVDEKADRHNIIPP